MTVADWLASFCAAWQEFTVALSKGAAAFCLKLVRRNPRSDLRVGSGMARKSKPTAPKRDAPRGGTALLIIDMINPLDFDGAEKLRPQAARITKAISKLRAAMQVAGKPVIFVNDNFGEWHSDRDKLVAGALAATPEVARKLAPKAAEYFVIKPQFSGFYATNLALLLPKLGISRLILTGIATDICILFTAADAHMRDYALWVPEDGVAAESDMLGAAALQIMREHLGAETSPTSDLTLHKWINALNNDGVC